MSGNGATTASALRAQLARVDRSREQIAKAWLVDVILNSRLSDLEQVPVGWATGELPFLISEILSALGREAQALDPGALERAARLSEGRGQGTSPAQLAREVSYLHSALLSGLRTELATTDPELFAEAAERLAASFTQISGATVQAFSEQSAPQADAAERLPAMPLQQRLEQMIAATKRYGHPFALLILDVEGPGTREPEASGPDGVMGVVSHAVRGSIRLMDEAYQTEAEAVCVLAPNQTAADAAHMAHRLAQILERLERAGGLQITVSTGVVACPEHGEEPGMLLHAADTAMWRSRATGQPVTVGGLQDR